MTSVRQPIADVNRREVWTDAQRTVLRGAFTAVADVLEKSILLKGVVLDQTIAMERLPLVMLVPFNKRPVAVVVLSATKVSDGSTISIPPILWTYANSATSASVQITDIDILDGEEYEIKVLMVEAVG